MSKDRRSLVVRPPGQRERTERTPYYVVGLPAELVDYLKASRLRFIVQFGRDYQDDDPQLWQIGSDDQPATLDNSRLFLGKIADRMQKTNHHPAHCYAVVKTQNIIYGCGNCVDDCPDCNFRYVPEAWSRAWKDAVYEYEKWRPAYTESNLDRAVRPIL